jgi:hypothetical protein
VEPSLPEFKGPHCASASPAAIPKFAVNEPLGPYAVFGLQRFVPQPKNNPLAKQRGHTP